MLRFFSICHSNILARNIYSNTLIIIVFLFNYYQLNIISTLIPLRLNHQYIKVFFIWFTPVVHTRHLEDLLNEDELLYNL